MRLITYVDAEGVIAAMITSPEGAPRPSLPNLGPNLTEVEIDAPDITEDLDTATVSLKLNHYRNDFKVDHATKKFMRR